MLKRLLSAATIFAIFAGKSKIAKSAAMAALNVAQSAESTKDHKVAVNQTLSPRTELIPIPKQACIGTQCKACFM